MAVCRMASCEMPGPGSLTRTNYRVSGPQAGDLNIPARIKASTVLDGIPEDLAKRALRLLPFPYQAVQRPR